MLSNEQKAEEKIQGKDKGAPRARVSPLDRAIEEKKDRTSRGAS
jgi:hypothetical protein